MAVLAVGLRPPRVGNGVANPPLSLRVGGVVLMRSQKQVVRAHAFAIVAVMANQQSARNRAVVNLPRHPMRLLAVLPLSGEEHSVAVLSVDRASPLPAAIGLPHSLPETFLDGTDLQPAVVVGEESSRRAFGVAVAAHSVPSILPTSALAKHEGNVTPANTLLNPTS